MIQKIINAALDPNNVEITFLISVVILYVLYRYSKLILAPWLRKRTVIDNSPLLVSYYSNGASLISLNEGVIAGMPYNFITSNPSATNQQSVENFITTKQPTAICRVELPFKTQTHVVVISNTSKKELGLHEFLATRKLERIELEGDFPSHVALFSPPGNQFSARYTLDPQAMAFIVDFGSTHHWEIIRDELYFVTNRVVGEATDYDGTPLMTDDIERFVKEIKPALTGVEKSTSPLHNRSYGTVKQNMVCPVCSETLTVTEHSFNCPNGHGLLITGPTLIAIRKEAVKVTLSEVPAVPRSSRRPLNCPNCSKKMQLADYLGKGVELDSCTYCGCRWVDRAEQYIVLG